MIVYNGSSAQTGQNAATRAKKKKKQLTLGLLLVGTLRLNYRSESNLVQVQSAILIDRK